MVQVFDCGHTLGLFSHALGSRAELGTRQRRLWHGCIVPGMEGGLERSGWRRPLYPFSWQHTDELLEYDFPFPLCATSGARRAGHVHPQLPLTIYIIPLHRVTSSVDRSTSGTNETYLGARKAEAWEPLHIVVEDHARCLPREHQPRPRCTWIIVHQEGAFLTVGCWTEDVCVGAAGGDYPLRRGQCEEMLSLWPRWKYAGVYDSEIKCFNIIVHISPGRKGTQRPTYSAFPRMPWHRLGSLRRRPNSQVSCLPFSRAASMSFLRPGKKGLSDSSDRTNPGAPWHH